MISLRALPAIVVTPFRLDRDAVSRGAFLAFVQAHPQWRRSVVKPAHGARDGYLADWRGDLDAGLATERSRPVTSVSWFAAQAFCVAQGKRLPTVAEWEYAAAASATMRDATRDPAFIQEVLTLYANRPSSLPPVGTGRRNVFGVRGLHGVVWEWAADFDGAPVRHEPHHAAARDHDQSCASAAMGADNTSNYPAFLRHAVRSGLTAHSTMGSLGFRCAA